MKLNCGPTKEQRREAAKIAAHDRVGFLRSWHPVFAWLPVRIGPNDCRWFETVERRFRAAWVDTCYRDIEIHLRLPEYRPLNG